MIMYIFLIGLAMIAVGVAGRWITKRAYAFYNQYQLDCDHASCNTPDELGLKAARCEKEWLEVEAGKVAPEPKIQISVIGATEAMKKLGAVLGAMDTFAGGKPVTAVVHDRVQQKPVVNIHKPYFDKHDLWVGLYWRYESLLDNLDSYRVVFYLIVLPTIVLKITRTVRYTMVPRTISTVCLDCGQIHACYLGNMLPLEVDRVNGFMCQGRFE